jgi:hypothetical protein
MKEIRWPLLLMALAISTTTIAQDAPPAEQGDAPPQAEPPAASAPPSTPPAPGTRASEDVFVPTEEIAADEEITFPVDI